MAEEIVGEILWTDSAKTSFSKIIEYLKTEWTEKEVGKFVNQTADLLSNLKRYRKCAALLPKERMYGLELSISTPI
jgi:hypothetical protein